jgi:hypothetical protein
LFAGARNLGLDDPRAVRPDSPCNFGDRRIRAAAAGKPALELLVATSRSRLAVKTGRTLSMRYASTAPARSTLTVSHADQSRRDGARHRGIAGNVGCSGQLQLRF